jgi:hypothetical protein
MDTILGHGKKDLALLLSYVVSERYLADRGRLGFLITQGAFKTAGAGEGFRRFHTERGPCSWGVRRVHDLAQLEPFSHAATQTCLFTWERGLSTEYPVPYVVWQPQPHGSSTIAAEATLSEVEQSTTRVTCLAEPVDATSPASTWLTLPAAAREPLRRLLGSSPYLAHEGVNSGGCNGVYWLELLEQRAGNLWRVRNLTAGARRPVPQVESLLEADLLFPLLRGREVRTWQATTSASILLVQDVATRKGLSAEIMQQRYPHAFDYLNHFATELRSRAAFTRYFTRRVRGSAVETAPFWSMFNVGSYTLSPWKVVWHRMITPLGAVVVGSQQGKPILPQETHAFIATASADEAYYLAGLLNSLPLQVAALSCSQAGSKGFGSPQLIGRLNLPSFEPQQAQHLQIATLAKARQGVEAKSDPAAARHLQQQLDLAAARLFELDAAACDVLATTATLFTSSLAHASLSDASLASTSPAEASQADPMPE